jgi:DNA invertase Pin-like site-specific DNA recombinase
MADAILSERISRAPMTRAALYVRVSTANNGQDPTMQTRELREYCERRGWQILGEYVDVGISGAKEKRPELERLMVDGHKRRFDAVEVWKFDRFARSVSHLLRALETFRSLGVEFVSFFRTDGHHYASRQEGLYCVGGCRGSRAQPDHGAG